ncbi:MAG TPA: discoidin domain-containing protein, partial [Bacteroidota bacterium]
MKSRLLILSLFVVGFFTARAQDQTRGVGVYPGDPAEDYSPGFIIDSIRYRNLALHRPAYQSGSYDYNLTAQLITDGFTSNSVHGPIPPGWIVTTASTGGVLPRNEREWVLDRHPMTRNTLEGPQVWLQVELAGNPQIPLLDSIIVSGTILTDSLLAKPWVVSVRGSSDGTNWKLLGRTGGATLPGDTLTGFLRRFSPPNLRAFSLPFRLDSTDLYRFYRINANSPNALRWGISEFGMYQRGQRATVGGPYRFTSAWKSAGTGEEWVSVDLGAQCTIYALDLNWIRRASEGSVQVSSDGAFWKKIASLSDGPESLEVLKLAVAAHGRFVRILMKKPASADGYILSELQVFGTGGPVPVPHAPAKARKDGRMDLAGGDWRIQRESAVSASGERIASARFDAADWLVATVPGTVLVSYLNAGAIPEPNFGANQLAISESFFYSDFWYRDQFTAPPVAKGRRVRLNFDGINWKADVYLNGHALGAIEGAFCRGAFDVTHILVPGEKNFLAVRIHRNSAPGFATEQTRFSPDANGGELGADNPTFHASVGWDWIPTIRGRNTGIWNNVYLSESGPVTIGNPFVSATIPLPDTTRADIRLSVTLHNSDSSDVAGTLRGSFGRFAFEEPVRLSASETKTILLDPSRHSSLHLQKPRLWWPSGYGAQNLYRVNLAFLASGECVSDSCSFMTGVRQMSYSEEGGALKIWVNGRRFIARGGNWGFPESMLRYRSREYDIAVRYHKEMNFTMIRNWVGQTADDAFFEACDRHGIMVWQDFWLATPLDGPDPDDAGLFMRNAADFVDRIRNHPSVALYVGRNEGNPPAAIDTALR